MFKSLVSEIIDFMFTSATSVVQFLLQNILKWLAVCFTIPVFISQLCLLLGQEIRVFFISITKK